MPHVSIEYFPRDLSDAEKQSLAHEITASLQKYLGASEQSISIAMQEVAPADWKKQVYDPKIKAHLDTLVKKPGYEY
ncbi:tautomerase PptA [Celerinatantimonas sp. YJH-8]|uniref:tautomerase PptA n=1 Tax=Celerinatantimonas sp. YJH-8 TaxID=3228714 RepID=UPI0038C0F261